MAGISALVDTNVVLDVLARRRPHYEDAARIWTLAETAKLEAYVAAVSFTDVFYIVRRFADLSAAKQAVRSMRDTFKVAACDAQILHQAIDADWADLEDAVQYFSACHCDAHCIITRNAPDFKDAHLDVLSPAEFLAHVWMREP
jgi:predicted nucleic acid-binding protein